MAPKKQGPSPNFTWAEVNPHGFKGLTPKLRLNARKHARMLERLRAEINVRRRKHKLQPTGIKILSWWRPAWYNKQIGGAQKSQHIHARATDISRQEVKRLMPWSGGELEFDRICQKIFQQDGFGQYPGGSRHVDNRGYRARWSSFRPGK